MKTTRNIPYPLPDLDYFETQEGEVFEVYLEFEWTEEAIDHVAWISGGEVHGHDIMGEVAGDLEGSTVLVSDEDGTYWAVDKRTAQRVSEEAHQCLKDYGSMHYPSNFPCSPLT